MRILLLDHYYESFVQEHYATHPHMRQATFEAQLESLGAELFGETQFEAQALRRLGHEVLFFPVNVPPLAHAWAREHGLRIPAGWKERFRRGGLRLRLSGAASQIPLDPLLASLREDYPADIVHVQCMDMLRPSHLEQLRSPAVRLIGQSAAPRFPGGQVQAYDLFISSLPNFVGLARDLGAASHLLPLAFDAGLAAAGSPGSRDVSVSFVGGMPESHARRTQYLARVARSVDIDIWSPDSPPDWPDSATHARFHGPAWGRAMYDILARSRITVNVHGEHAEGHANNLRLFEATGMGAMLVTDGKRNIRDLFEPGEEVVVFETADELVELLAYYSSHPGEAAEIARRGQARTLRDHTWDRRMQQFVTLLDAA